MIRRTLCSGSLILGLIAAAGCNAPAVQRKAEIHRFEQAMADRAAKMPVNTTQPLTTAECVDLALANSLDLRVRQLSLRLNDEDVRIALSQGLPRASLEYVQSDRSNEPLIQAGNQQFAFEDRRQERLAIAAIVPALDWGVTWYGYQIAKDERKQQWLLLQRAAQLLRRDVQIAYTRHAGAIRQEKLSRTAYDAAQQVLRVAQNLEREKLAVAADTALVRAALAQAGLELSLAVQRVAETHMILAQLMSLPPGVDFSIHPELPRLPSPPTAEQVAAWEDSALLSRPELAVQDLQRHISANSVRQQAAAFFPRVDLIGAYNWSNNSAVVNPSFFQYGFTVSHSLLDGGATIWRYQRAKAEANVEATRTLLLSLGVVYEVQLSALRVKQNHDTVGASEVLEKSRRAGFDRIVSLYKEGLEDEAGAARSLADLTSQATILDRAQTDYLASWYELEATVLPVAPATTRPTTQPGDR